MRLYDEFVDQYKSEYREFVGNTTRANVDAVVARSGIQSEILYFSAQDKKHSSKTFVVIPSIFNSPDILTTYYPNDFISHLRNFGDVYLLKWKYIANPDFTLTDYAAHAKNIADWIATEQKTNVTLVGHCVGGLFAIATSVILGSKVDSMILLTCPWDFSHFSIRNNVLKILGIDKLLSHHTHIPAAYLQILFFLLSPNHPASRLQSCDLDKELFFAIESWQFSGYPLPRATYNELMHEIVEKNILRSNMWDVEGTIINVRAIHCAVALITGTKDRIVPMSSTSSLHTIIPHTTLYEYNTGHIGYLIGSRKKQFFEDISAWLEKYSTVMVDS